MKKYVTIFLPVATLVIGLVGGWFASARSHNRWVQSYIKTDEFTHLGQRCRVLVDLRAGKTNEAVTTLETLMAGDILGCGAFLRNTPPDEHRAADVKLLSGDVGRGVFAPLANEAFFRTVHLGQYGQIAWSEDIAICPDSAYEEITGRPAEAPHARG